MTSILVVEDDLDTAAEISACLSGAGFNPAHCLDGLVGVEMALTGRFSAMTLDRMLPGCDGLAVVKAVREAGLDIPILMLSAIGDLDERVASLRAGGDDYLIKPFAPSELAARIEVLLRRHRRSIAPELSLKVGDLELDLVTREAVRRGRRIELLPMEFQLLEFMMRNAGQMLSRRQIFETVWNYYFDPGTNLIAVHVGRLRKKLDIPGDASIFTTERGVGYMINVV